MSLLDDMRLARKRDEAKRQAFVEQLAIYPQERVVYVEQAGMDNRDDYAYGWKQGERFQAMKSGRRLSSSQYERLQEKLFPRQSFA